MTVPPIHLTHVNELVSLLQRHGFHTSKSLGQHFLISPHALAAIIAACELADGLPVLEIGPGIGTVTRALAEQGAHVTAVELDRRALQVLQETVGAFPAVQVLQGDILHVDLSAILGEQRWTVVGNLPYYITTPVISRILDFSDRVERAIFLVQREVAERMQAAPGSKIYGSLSVYVQVYAAVERVARVPRGAFFPPPTVESAVVRLVMRREPLVPPALQPTFFSVVRAAFGQRRKTLETALLGGEVLPGGRPAVAEMLAAVGIASSRRGETLDIAEFRQIAEEVARRR
ncbi:MAG TPA: 16S rRNA (adenine(1518)-N(6)/adenine(1519)-N(6))-dimethyltransferase RsmA [Armatimonadota bacterium]|jgi:16S rRNA (adenine1518-N6/adenine1519-N6)-dimethyltransferase